MHTIQTILLVAPILLFSVIAHEIAHGYAALQQGDRTALEAGRLSWNPLKHIDPYLTVILPLIMLTGSAAFGGRLVVFGGAKPVPVDPRNYKHIRRGDIIVSLAGVFTNLLIALGCALVIVLTGLLARGVVALEPSVGILQAMMVFGIQLNFVLIFFNLLPIPPLDGSHVMKYLLPRPLAIRYVQFGRYGMIILILLLFIPAGDVVLRTWLKPANSATDFLLQSVQSFAVESAGQWLQ
ncbi:MAG: site-2 protease family protein [bacterium]